MEARSQYLMAEALELARMLQIASQIFPYVRGFYDGVRRLNAEMLNYEGHPSS